MAEAIPGTKYLKDKQPIDDNFYDVLCKTIQEMEIILGRCKSRRCTSVGQNNRMQWIIGALTIFKDVAYEETL